MTTSVCQLGASNNNNHNNTTIKTANTRKTTTATQTAKPQSLQPPQLPLSARRRPQNLKSSLLLLGILMCQLQQFAGGGCGGLAMAAPAPVSAPAFVSTPTTAPAYRLALANRTRRVQKRQNHNFNVHFRMTLNNSDLDWSNTCGGNWTGHDSPIQIVGPQKRCIKHKKYLRTLHNKTNRELRNLKDENRSSKQGINISNLSRLDYHKKIYLFLPTLNNSDINSPLRRIHRDLQFYVAAFSYMNHAQLYYDYNELQYESKTSYELRRYRKSARDILCYVEEAINGTKRLHLPGTKKLPLAAIKTVKRKHMEERLLMFQTPLVELHKKAVYAARNPGVTDAPTTTTTTITPTTSSTQTTSTTTPASPKVVNEYDAFFLKYHYLQYLKHMNQLLTKQRKRNCGNKRPKKVAQRIKSPQRQPKRT